MREASREGMVETAVNSHPDGVVCRFGSETGDQVGAE